jgi:hypothetical protein
LAAGLLGAGAAGSGALAQAPGRLAPGRSIYRLSGEVRVDGRPATPGTRIASASTLETGRGAEVVWVVGDNAFLLRGESRVVLEPAAAGSAFLSGLRILSGRILSVLAPGRPLQLRTSAATIGIRGTGVYVEDDPGQSYVCTCYGLTEIASADDPGSRRTVESRHHDRPLYVLKGAPAGRAIREAPVINHTDEELVLLEALVGRKPPFEGAYGEGPSQRRY